MPIKRAAVTAAMEKEKVGQRKKGFIGVELALISHLQKKGETKLQKGKEALNFQRQRYNLPK